MKISEKIAASTDTKKLLCQLPRYAPLRVKINPEPNKPNKDKVDAVFHHIDGSYSYCTIGTSIKDKTYADAFRIRAWTEVTLVDGRWEFDQSE